MKSKSKNIIFIHVYQFYKNNDQIESALHVILKAISFFPNDAGLYRMAGNLYQKLGIEHRAEEAFRRAGMLNR